MLHIINDGIAPGISLYYNIIIINIVNILYTIPHKEAINNLIKLMGRMLVISQLILFLFYLVGNLLVFWFYIPGINGLCSQAFMLRKIFKIFEMQE